LALLEPWKEDLLEAEDLPDAMDVIMSAPSLLVDVDLTMQQAFDLVGANGTGLKKETAPAPAGDDGALEQEENNRGKNGYRSKRLVSEPSITNHLVSTDELDYKMSSI
jgi:hypothetical protein